MLPGTLLYIVLLSFFCYSVFFPWLFSLRSSLPLSLFRHYFVHLLKCRTVFCFVCQLINLADDVGVDALHTEVNAYADNCSDD